MVMKVIATLEEAAARYTRAGLAAMNKSELVKALTAAREAYYNTAPGKLPIMTDALFDYGEDLLRAIDPKHKYWKQVGHDAVEVTRNQKVRLSIPMGSLGKVRTADEINRFLAGLTEVDVSDKLDGLSMQIPEKSGKLSAFTRGNGTVGQDVTHLLPHINGIGKPIKGWTIRGEVVIPGKRFTGAVAAEFKNPRNLASGIVNSKGVSKHAGLLDFVVHGVQKPDNISLKQAEATLKAAGWKVAFTRTLKGKTIARQLPVYLAARVGLSKYEIDGVVLTTPNGVIAFKGQDLSAIGTVDHVEWNVSKHGLFKPVVVLKKPLQLDGVGVQRITAYNAKFIQDNQIGPGALVEVVRSGKVIPKIVQVLKKTKAQLPDGNNWEWNVTKVDIVLKQGQTNDHAGTIKTSKLAHFVTKVGVEGAKGGLLARLVDAGIDTPKRLCKATVAKMQQAGLGPTQATKLHTDLAALLHQTPLAAMLDASGFWPRGWAESRFTLLLNVVPWDQLVEAQANAARITGLISSVPGLGAKTAEGFGPALKKFLKFASDIGYTVQVPTKPKRGKLLDKRFAFTGFRDSQLEQMIKQAGGTVGGMSKTTHYLVVTDKNATSTKVDAARAQNPRFTTIITIPELQKLLK